MYKPLLVVTSEDTTCTDQKLGQGAFLLNQMRLFHRPGAALGSGKEKLNRHFHCLSQQGALKVTPVMRQPPTVGGQGRQSPSGALRDHRDAWRLPWETTFRLRSACGCVEPPGWKEPVISPSLPHSLEGPSDLAPRR